MEINLKVFSTPDHVKYSLLNRVMRRLGSRALFAKANKYLLHAVEEYNPDIVWIFKGIEYEVETLKKIKRRGIKLVNYNPDHPFIRTSISHGGQNIEDCVPLYDLHFCYSRDLAVRIEKEFGVQSAWLPFGYELDEPAFQKISGAEEIHRIGFVGNPDRSRANTIRRLADAGLPVDIYGHNWHRFIPKHRNINVFDAVYGVEFWQKIRQYRVQLNIFRPHNIGSHNMRTFEIPAAGGIMLAPDSPEHRAFFTHEIEAYFYQSEDEIEHYCRHLLANKSVGDIRENARRRNLKEDYSYRNRAITTAKTLMNI